MTIGGAGVYDYSDGRRHEGVINGSGPHGPGAMWDAKGALIRAGLWKDGGAVDGG